jgi:hypothetical protein
MQKKSRTSTRLCRAHFLAKSPLIIASNLIFYPPPCGEVSKKKKLGHIKGWIHQVILCRWSPTDRWHLLLFQNGTMFNQFFRAALRFTICFHLTAAQYSDGFSFAVNHLIAAWCGQDCCILCCVTTERLGWIRCHRYQLFGRERLIFGTGNKIISHDGPAMINLKASDWSIEFRAPIPATMAILTSRHFAFLCSNKTLSQSSSQLFHPISKQEVRNRIPYQGVPLFLLCLLLVEQIAMLSK